MTKKLKTEIVNYTFILTGSLVLAFGVVAFLSPNHIATGGTAGLAIILHHLFNQSIGVMLVLINLPLLVVSIKYLGKRFAFKTMVCILFVSVFVDVLAKTVELPALSSNLLLATLYGGVIIGIGLGLVFKGGASAGGGTILAKIIATNTSIKTSTVVLILDAAIVVLAGIVFKSIEVALWSLISIYVASQLIDAILVGAHNKKIVHISSSKNLTELSNIIFDQLGLKGTLVTGNDLAATEFKHIIFIMIEKSKISVLKQLVSSYDKSIIMIVMEAVEVLGKED
ncbi:MAG: YitT family protein [Bacteroidia bacterium]